MAPNQQECESHVNLLFISGQFVDSDPFAFGCNMEKKNIWYGLFLESRACEGRNTRTKTNLVIFIVPHFSNIQQASHLQVKFAMESWQDF